VGESALSRLGSNAWLVIGSHVGGSESSIDSVSSTDDSELCLWQLFKNVAERGRWSEMVMEAHSMYRDSNTDGALLLYTFLAELGYEVAQSNVAYMLDKSTSTGY